MTFGISHSALIVAAALAIGSTACVQAEEEYVPPALELGFVEDGEFVALEDGGECFIQDAIQGGFWSMPVIRVQGVGDSPEVRCTLTDHVLGEVLGTSSSTVSVSEEEDSAWLRGQLRIPLSQVNRAVFPELDEHLATLECTVISNVAELIQSNELTITTVRFETP